MAEACSASLLGYATLVACSLVDRLDMKAPQPAYELPEPAPPALQPPSSAGDDEGSDAPVSGLTASPARVRGERVAAPLRTAPFHLSPWESAPEGVHMDGAAESSPAEPSASVVTAPSVQPSISAKLPAAGAPLASCCDGTHNRTGKVSTMWLLEWRYLWGAALAMVVGCWLFALALARRRERQRASRLALPRLSDEDIAFLALTWQGAPVLDMEPVLVPMHASVHEASSVSAGDAAVPAPVAEISSPLDAVFNQLSTPGGVCATRSMGDALREQEPIIRAAVDMGEGPGVSFKIAGAVEWPLWARLYHADAEVVSMPALAKSSTQAPAAGKSETSSPIAEAPAVPSPENVAPAELLDALESFLRQRPDDLETKRAVGLSLLADAQDQLDEPVRAGMLDASIRILREVAHVDHDNLPAEKLGEACYLRAQIGPDIDGELLGEAEQVLREAMQQDTRPHSGAAWQLQRVLRAAPRGMARERVAARLEEACSLLARGAETPCGPSAWKAALLTTEWRWLMTCCQNATERRLRLRELYARWLPAMEAETTAEVLAAWVGLLCAMAQSLSAPLALERYTEARRVLRRLLADDGESARYARAVAQMALGRARLEHGLTRSALLDQADTVLLPFIDRDDSLRLEACRVALTQAQGKDMVGARSFYLRAVELARPLTAAPTFTVDALRCMLTALLALGEEKDRRVYAKCLEIVAEADDADSQLLLAECHLRRADHGAGCLHAELAWRAGAALSPTLLALWQAAYPAWAARAGTSAELARNRQSLRMASSAAGVSRRAAPGALAVEAIRVSE